MNQLLNITKLLLILKFIYSLSSYLWPLKRIGCYVHYVFGIKPHIGTPKFLCGSPIFWFSCIHLNCDCRRLFHEYPKDDTVWKCRRSETTLFSFFMGTWKGEDTVWKCRKSKTNLLSTVIDSCHLKGHPSTHLHSCHCLHLKCDSRTLYGCLKGEDAVWECMGSENALLSFLMIGDIKEIQAMNEVCWLPVDFFMGP